MSLMIYVSSNLSNLKTMFKSSGIIIVFTLVFFPPAVADAGQVYGHIGETVLLRSGISPPGTIDTIFWTIFKNFTYIATFEDSTARVNMWYQFNGRLELNTFTGDLTIKNVTPRDAMTYKMELRQNGHDKSHISLVELSVLEPLKKPTVSVLHSVLDKGKCVIVLKCSSSNNKVTLSWKPEYDLSEPFYSDTRVSESVLWSSISKQTATFTCIATDTISSKSSSKAVKCTEPNLTSCSESNLQRNFLGAIVIPTIMFSVTMVGLL